MNAQERLEAAAPALKIFPLPAVVLFPQTMAPLHIFEPRYRAMIKDALEGDRTLALAQLEPGFEADYFGRPPLKPLLCAGLIVWHEELPDQRYNILVQGVSRARLGAELPSRRPYREASVTLLADPPYAGPEEEPLRQAVLELGNRLPAALGQSLLQAAVHNSGGALADVIGSAVVSDVERRQQLFEELSVPRRLKAALAEVTEAIVRLAPAKPEGLVQ